MDKTRECKEKQLLSEWRKYEQCNHTEEELEAKLDEIYSQLHCSKARLKKFHDDTTAARKLAKDLIKLGLHAGKKAIWVDMSDMSDSDSE